MKSIQLTQNKIALVDDDDYEHLSKWKWCYDNKYAARSQHLYMENGKQISKRIRMHRIIIDCPDGYEVDHINRNKLDNRKRNLRIVTRSENMLNINPSKANKSGFVGVSWTKNMNKYESYVTINKKKINIGYFKSAKEAARARVNYLNDRDYYQDEPGWK